MPLAYYLYFGGFRDSEYTKACGKRTVRDCKASAKQSPQVPPDTDEDDIGDKQDSETSRADDDEFKMNSKDDEEVKDEESDAEIMKCWMNKFINPVQLDMTSLEGT